MNQHQLDDRKNMSEGNPKKIKVLMYHRIVDTVNLSYSYPKMCIHIDEFRRHLSLLERWGFSSITFDDYRLFKAGEINLPKKPVIITFDDGYTDTYELAFPALKEYGMKAVVFVVGDRSIATSSWDEAYGLPTAQLMNEQQILELHRNGFEIGSHSMTHPKLPLLSREKAWEEISRSRMLLEILLNAPVRTFAFPYGLANSATKQMLEDAGYTIGCGTYTGPPVFISDPFEVRRIFMFGGIDLLGFACRALMPYEYYAWLRWKVKHFFSRTNQDENGHKYPATGDVITLAQHAIDQ